MGGAQAEEPSSWPRCGSQDCIGIQLPGQGFCLAHVAEEVRAAFLAGLVPGSDLDLRGTPIDSYLLTAVLDALKEDEQPRLGDARFGEAQFSGKDEYVGTRFFGKPGFVGAQFGGETDFEGAQFSGYALFGKAQFSEYALFAGAQFSGNVGFENAKFGGDAEFEGAQFKGDAEFEGAQFRGDALFGEAQFSAARVLGPLIAESNLSLQQASFSAPILIEAATPRLALVGVAFQEAATLRVRFTDIVLDGVSFTKPSTISFAESVLKIGSTSELNDDVLETSERGARPRLRSLRLVDLSNLVLGDLDLSACLFQGAHNLEKLRIEGPLRFNLTPGAWRVRLRRWWIPVWRTSTRRQALAEEHHFRAQQSSPRRRGIPGRLRIPTWDSSDVQQADWVQRTTGQPVQTLKPENLAALYRALRKGLEDQQNAPATADFYYGEMEMRRISSTAPLSDRFVLWVYWLVSGYGLRASRALAAFALLVPFFAIGFWLWGLDPDHGHRVSYPIALLRSFESATSLLRPPPQGLTYIGQLLDAVLRLIGATLLGLALFSLRGRIKR